LLPILEKLRPGSPAKGKEVMMRMDDLETPWAARMLSVLRVVAGLVFWQHGVQKILQFPLDRPGPELFSMSWFAGAIEFVLAPPLIVGLLTRPVAFILAGEMAFAYWIGHAPRGFFPYANGGNLAIMYCFVFLYLAFAGGGPWSMDHAMRRKGVAIPAWA
jgi:putative oxidoreductase